MPPQSNLGPVVVGLLVVAIGMTYGLNAGYAINPARDFGAATLHRTCRMGRRGVQCW